jgi:amino acid transporter
VEVGVSAIRSVRGRHVAEWGWFCVWAVVGGCVAISFISFVGPFFLPGAALGALAGMRWGRSSVARSSLGAVTGAGIPFLIVAYLERKGPGTVCWKAATATGCDDYLDPRPWLVIGLVLVLGGIAAFLGAQGRRATPHR